jgi:hypothetical protein
MVQKSRTGSIIWKVSLRLLALFISFFIAIWGSSTAIVILKNYLGYVTPEGFFGFTLTDDFVSLDLMLVFLSGIFLGTLGKKADYFIFIVIFLQALWEYNGTSTITDAMFFGLFGAALIGNAIGFGLKLLRQKFLPKLKV